MKLKKCEIMQQEPLLTEEKIIKGLENKRCIKKWAYICHDKDVYTTEDEKANKEHKTGTLKTPHWHIMIQFNDSQDTKYISQWFDVEEQYVSKSNCNRFEPMLSYLIHKNDTTKYQYEPKAVKANFDYMEFVQSGGTNARKLEIIQQIHDGIIKPFNYTNYINVYEYHKYKSAIADAYKYRSDMIRSANRNMEVMYIHGPSGTGKTTLAKWIADKKGYSYHVTGSGNDILGKYLGQDCIILDDIRASSLKFNDFLKLLDNHTNSDVQSRFDNVYITECKLMIITSIYSLDDFYKTVFNELTEPVLQLKRRCKTYLDMGIYRVKAYQFDIVKSNYKYTTEYDNPVIDYIIATIKQVRTVGELDDFLCMESVKHITGLDLKKKTKLVYNPLKKAVEEVLDFSNVGL